ncbi:MAG: hypothetical protein M1828_002825 [Chrysothrix sp. TS-e1954]|nr:MAG: hypothetical protein M1828_002825 [Chrysothrix sp. TS-e1954]
MANTVGSWHDVEYVEKPWSSWPTNNFKACLPPLTTHQWGSNTASSSSPANLSPRAPGDPADDFVQRKFYNSNESLLTHARKAGERRRILEARHSLESSLAIFLPLPNEVALKILGIIVEASTRQTDDFHVLCAQIAELNALLRTNRTTASLTIAAMRRHWRMVLTAPSKLPFSYIDLEAPLATAEQYLRHESTVEMICLQIERSSEWWLTFWDW